MMQVFLHRLGHNLQTRRGETVAVLLGLAVAIFVGTFIIGAIFGLGFFSFITAAVLVMWVATRQSKLYWFWSKSPPETPTQDSERDREQAEHGIDVSPQLNSDGTLPGSQPISEQAPTTPAYNSHFQSVRETPQGTQLVSADHESAVILVKSAKRFWCWFLPGLFFVSALPVGIPLGSFFGYLAFEGHPETYRLNPVSYVFWGSLLTILAFLTVGLIAYFSTRPWLRFTVYPESIAVDDRLFDRRHHYGMQIGYKSGEDNLKNSFFDQSFGVQALRLTYGPWGEDLSYMVNSYHAAEIVNWMNDIIDGVGAPPPKRYDPYKGHKIELL